MFITFGSMFTAWCPSLEYLVLRDLGRKADPSKLPFDPSNYPKGESLGLGVIFF